MGWLSNLFGGGSNKTTTTTNSAPWGPAQNSLKLGIKQANKLFNADPTGQNFVYGGSTVVPWSQQTRQGMNLVRGNAQRNMGGAGLSGQYQDIINQAGYNNQQRTAADELSSVLGGPGLTSAQRNALNNNERIANSSFNINANPAFQKVLQQAQGSARDSVNMSAGSAGRYGGAIHQGNLASEVGDLTARMVGNEYTNWQNRKDAANNNLFNMGQTGLANRMGAANNLFNMGQSAIGNLGTAYSGLNQPAQDLMQVGAMNEDLATRQMNDKLRIFNEKNQAPWDQIGRLNAIASGAGQMGGTQTTATPGQNPFLTAMGYGLTGGGLLGGLFG